MASRTTREGERNLRANDYLQTNKSDFSRNLFITAQIEALAAEIARTGNFYEEQIANDGGARQNYEIAEEADDALSRLMRDIADFAVTARDEIEGIEEKFRIPRTGGKRGRIARARVFAVDAVPHRQILGDRGLGPNFIEVLIARTDRLEQALAAAVSKTAERVGATDAKMSSHKSSNKIIVLIDPVIRHQYRDDPAKLAAWDYASRVRRDPEPKPKTEKP